MSEHNYTDANWVQMVCLSCGEPAFEGRRREGKVIYCRRCPGVMAERGEEQPKRIVVVNRKRLSKGESK